MAEKVNLVIDQGTTFTAQFEIYDENDDLIDFSNYTGNSQLRKSYFSSNSYSFVISLSNNGLVTLSMNSYTTNSISAGRYVYDVEVENNALGIKTRIVEGVITITPQVTK